MIEFAGRKYDYDKTTGYYKARKRYANRDYLHRDMWRAEHGNIPHGWLVHHKNEDKDDNRIENFECMPRSEHMARHRAALLAGLSITGVFVCEWCGVEYEGVKRPKNRWCGKTCGDAFHHSLRALKRDTRQ